MEYPIQKENQRGRTMRTKQNTRMVFPFQIHTFLFLLLLCPTLLTAGSNQTSSTTAISSSETIPNNTFNTTVRNTANPANPSPLQRNSSSNSTSQNAVPGCAADLNPVYSYLCDRQAAWGIVVESLATLGFVVCVGLLVGLLLWMLWLGVSSRWHNGIGGRAAAMALFLLATAGLFALTFAFIIRLTPQTCPTRVFLFGVLFSLAFSCLLARCLALLGYSVARGWREVGLALALCAVQVVIATEWLITVLVRDGQPCRYSQGEFVMLLIYVLVLLAAGLLLSLCCVLQSCRTHSYSGTKQHNHVQATLLCLTLLLSAAIWVVWIALLTRGNMDMGRRPQWDDPVLSIALLTNGWVLLLGQGLVQVFHLCKGEAHSKEGPLDFGGWTSSNVNIPTLVAQKEGMDNESFQNDRGEKKGKKRPVLHSPYDPKISMREIDPDKDYTIPRPQTTIASEPFHEYYGHTLSD
ncbi:hypothetical protein UPYG_G00101970 [Umbra pygmaea]|uniref:G-protein coupled receptors family 3 profile domain-containing protein n=1 Tax=Umbra pygmaea TaxID=75934 RepID=A0ABD0XQM1_UMBPY